MKYCVTYQVNPTGRMAFDSHFTFEATSPDKAKQWSRNVLAAIQRSLREVDLGGDACIVKIEPSS